MRIDKFTTKFQEALGDAQSLALGKDHSYIETTHLLSAMLAQPMVCECSGTSGSVWPQRGPPMRWTG